MSVMTGEATVAAAQGTDVAADRLGALFDAHHQRLYRLARRLSGNAEDASDLVQETFLRAARAPASVPLASPDDEAWLVRVLVNLSRDRWRQSATRRRLDQTVDAAAVHSVDPEAAVVARSMVWQALNVLAPRRRAVLVMHELEGLPVDKIARLLGIAAVTVRWHLSRGRRQLAATIRSEGGKP
jgi:RNA polymerase sigma-70 factor, ECF subfamily